MDLQNPNNALTIPGLSNPSNAHTLYHSTNPFMDGYFDSAGATPFTSAPSSPGRSSIATVPTLVSPTYHPGYFVSCPASPMHYILTSAPATPPATDLYPDETAATHSGGAFEFYGTEAGGRMIPADEIFLNGKIRPLKLSLAPLPDLDEEEGDDEEGRGRELRGRSRSSRRRTRSMSPLRSPRFQWQEDDDGNTANDAVAGEEEVVKPVDKEQDEASKPPPSTLTSRNSRRWVFLKDLLYRSKSEGSGRSSGKELRFWHSISLKSKATMPAASPPATEEKVYGGRRARKPAVSAHEKHYTASRAQAEEMRRRTSLPYRQGVLGCLGFSSRSYGAIHGFAKALNPVSSR